MAAYVDYTFYSTSYLGTAIAESDFARLALRASAVIDQLTYNRAATADSDYTEAIQNACCAVAEELQRQEAASFADGITSESQGQYSVAFAANSSRAQTNTQKLNNEARLYLGMTGLMFAGFYSGEYGA